MEGRFANGTMATEVRCRTVALKFTANYGAHANITIHMKIAPTNSSLPPNHHKHHLPILAFSIGTATFANAGTSTALGNVHNLNSMLFLSPPDMLPSGNGKLQRAYHRNII